METVKVDIQKLQLLNDRIAQTIEALNQVRMSVHGIQHAQVSPWGYGAYPGAQLGFGQGYNPYTTPFVPQFGPQFGAPSFGPTPYGSFVGGMNGLSHTTPMTTNPWLLGNVTGIPGVTGYPTTGYPTTYPTTGYPGITGNGISHSSWDPNWQQSWQLRQQQFPFVQMFPTTLS